MKTGRVAGLSTLITMLLFGATTTAQADTVALVNRAQAGIESTVPQSPLSLMVRADCAFARTIEEARGGPSPCPAGTWPAPGGDWSPTVDVAAGDRLEIAFPSAQESVAVVGTSNYPTTLTDPDGKPISNEPLGTFVVASTADPRIWTATVPALDSRARFEGFSAIAVTAREANGRARNVAFRLQTPRNVDEKTRCGQAFYSASEAGYHCPGGGIPPGGGRPPTPIPAEIPVVPSQLVPPSLAMITMTKVKVASARIDATCSSMRLLVAPNGPGAVEFRASIAGRTIARWKRTLQARTTPVRLRFSQAARTRMRHSSRASVTLTLSSRNRVLTRRAITTRACKPNLR